MRALLLTGAATLLTVPGIATGQASMPGMDMKGPRRPAEPMPAVAPSDNHAAHDTSDTASPMPDEADPHAGHDAHAKPASPPNREGMDHTDQGMGGMPGMSPGATEIGTAPAPVPPTEHAADSVFDTAEMARAREDLRRENGAFRGSMILFDLAEYEARKGGDGYRWEGEAWLGGDIDRLLIMSRGEGTFGRPIEDVEIQALYSRAISPFWNAHVGVRHDIVPNPSRTYAVIGIEGIAPYWLHLMGQLFLSDNGDLRARLEGTYDERITQRLILQPRAEFNFSAQDMPAVGVGSGLSSVELGARLRYEIRKEFAPYVGLEWTKKVAGTAQLARMMNENPDTLNFVGGIRFWF